MIREIEQRGAHDLAHRVLGVASQVFRYGVVTRRCESDPARDLRGALTPHKPRNQHAVKPEELPALLRAIDGYDEIGDQQTALALRLLCLTFVRTWSLSAPNGWNSGPGRRAPTWEVPAARMKMKQPHLVPLSHQAVSILRELRAIAGDSRYVLPGPQSRQADQQQHAAVRALPARLQGQDDRARLPSRRLIDAQRERLSAPT